MLYFWAPDYTAQVIYAAEYTWTSWETPFEYFVWGLFRQGKHLEVFFLQWHAWYTHCFALREIFLLCFSQVCRDRKGRFHYCWHTEIILSVELVCLEKAWNERIPCGLPHIPLTLLNSVFASFYCTDHTQECAVSKHLRHLGDIPHSPSSCWMSIRKCKQSGLLRDISSNYAGQHHSALCLNCISAWQWWMPLEIQWDDRVEAKQTVCSSRRRTLQLLLF